MAFSFKYTRYTAIAQIVLGALSIIFGVADIVTIFRGYAGHTQSGMPVWMGIWFVVTGTIGCFGSKRNYGIDGRPSKALIGTYLGFSIVSVVFAGTIIIGYTIGIIFNVTGGRPCRNIRTWGYNVDYAIALEDECNVSTALGSMIIIFSILEFGFGIWASICSCANGCCDCCSTSSQQQMQGQVIYIQTPQGPSAYIMAQGTNGVPIGVPVTAQTVPAPALQAPQVIYPAVPPTYAGSLGAVPQTGGGAQGVTAAEGQTPALEPKEALPPVYQA